jgi:hypothetical protein
MLPKHGRESGLTTSSLLRRGAGAGSLTVAGERMLHTSQLLSQAEAAGEAVRRAAGPAKPCFALGFLTGQWQKEHRLNHVTVQPDWKTNHHAQLNSY